MRHAVLAIIVFSILALIFTTPAQSQTPEEEIADLRARAEQGHADAQYTLGVMYANGRGMPQDDAEAVRCYRLAADQGHAGAQYNLGVTYRDGGTGVPQDYAEAVRWYRLAADQGETLAQFNLGVMYDAGWGVPQDDAEAVRWYRLAADQGETLAQYTQARRPSLASVVGTRERERREIPHDVSSDPARQRLHFDPAKPCLGRAGRECPGSRRRRLEADVGDVPGRVPVRRCDRESRIPGSSRMIPAYPGLKLLIDLTVRAPGSA